MKRLIILAVLCAFVLSAAAASAADLKASGAFVVEARWADNWNFKSKNNENDMRTFDIKQRADVVFEFIANENLKAVMYTRTDLYWGRGAGAIGTTSTNAIGLRRAYLDFTYPDTTIGIRAGYQAVSLPAAVGGGSMILDEEFGSATVSGAITDNVSYLVGYGRLIDENNTGNAFIDAYIGALPLNFEGISVTPFAMYANIGEGLDASDAAADSTLTGLVATKTAANASGGKDFDNAYWLGASFTMDLFDPFVFAADINYGKVDSPVDANERDGWLFDASLAYKGFDFMTPEFFVAYTSGEDSNTSNGSERLPSVAAANWAVGSFFFGGDTLLIGSQNDRYNYLGFWTLGVTLKDIQSFAEGLSHTATILYAQGTNDKKVGTAYAGALTGIKYGQTLTEKDSLFEIDFNTAYKIYDELTMTFDLGYLNLDAKESVWGTDRKGGDAWKISTGLVYSF